jgi:hypothetical protein
MDTTYLVLKRTDIERYLSEDEQDLLWSLADKISSRRSEDNKIAENAYYVVDTDEPYTKGLAEIVENHEPDWNAALNHLMDLQANNFVLAITISPLLFRYRLGERTKELYDSIWRY